MATTRTAGQRIGIIVLATVLAGAAWAVITKSLGVHLEVGSKAATATHVGIGDVIAASLIMGLVAWAALALFERRGAKGVRTWTIISWCFFVVSLLGPLGGLTSGAKEALGCLHVIVATTLITGLRRSAQVAGRARAARSNEPASPATV